MLFSSVVGQQSAKGGIFRMWANNVFPHALLLVGPEGTGGLPLALALAQYIFCEQKGEADSCGQCPSCNKTMKLEHADLHLSFPTIVPKPNTKAMSRHYIQEFREFVKQSPYGTTYEWLQHINAENKQGNITTEECREIIDSLNLKSYEGGKKVLVMWRPEYLGNAGNMLLKLIEEPPADTILILVAENADHILATIKSRTQDIKLAPIPAADIALALSSRNMTDPRRAAQVAHIAMGSYTEALRLVRHADNDLFPDVKNLFNVIFTGNGLGIGKFVNDWSQVGREQQKNFLQYVIQLLEQAIRVRYRPEVLELLPEGESQFVKKLADMQITVEGIAQMSGTIGDTIYFIERNGHAKTQLHALALRLVYIVKGVAVPV